MKAADTSASTAMADWTPLTVVSRSRTTDAIETFISDVSTTSTNIAIARRSASRWLRAPSTGTPAVVSPLTRARSRPPSHLPSGATRRVVK
jgi:hypothetical protein